MNLMEALIQAKLGGGGGGGSSSDLLFTITATNSVGGYTFDKSFSEIEEAISAGKICVVDSYGVKCSLVEHQDGSVIVFAADEKAEPTITNKL